MKSLVLSGFSFDVSEQMRQSWCDGFRGIACNQSVADAYMSLHGERWRRTLDAVLSDVSDGGSCAFPGAEELRQLSVTTLMLNGSIKQYEREAPIFAAKKNPKISAAVVPDAGHLVQLDAPEIFKMIVERFWAKSEKEN